MLVPLGRWESGRAASRELRGIEAAWAGVGRRLDMPSLSGYRFTAGLRCLLYREGRNRFRYELCFAGDRLVEAIVRSRREMSVWTLRFEPRRASVRAPAGEIERVLARLGALRPDALTEVGVYVPRFCRWNARNELIGDLPPRARQVCEPSSARP